MVMINGVEWLTTKEAADFLGLSVSRVYHIKRYLTHRKGKSKSSRILFRKDTLIDNYLSI